MKRIGSGKATLQNSSDKKQPARFFQPAHLQCRAEVEYED